MSNTESVAVVRGYRYKITQSSKGARIEVHGDSLEETVLDYAQLRQRLESEGFRIAPEE